VLEAGSASGQDLLGDRLREVDPEGALALYRAAAEAGNTHAIASLAEMMAEGEH